MSHSSENSSLTFLIAIPVGPGGGARLPAVLASIAQQETDSFSVRVAAMDASGDPAVAAAFDAAGDLIAYRRTGRDGGQAEAIDAAWRHVPADILHWLNDDDFLAPGALARVHGMFAADMDLDVIYGQTAMLDADEAFVGLHHAFDAPSDQLLRSNCIPQPSCFVRRCAVEAVGGLDPALVYTMDWDLWIRLWRAEMRFVCVPDILSMTSNAPDTKTASGSSLRFREIFALVRRHAGLWLALKTTLVFRLHDHLSGTGASPLGRRLFRWLHRSGPAASSDMNVMRGMLPCLSDDAGAGIRIESEGDGDLFVHIQGECVCVTAGVSMNYVLPQPLSVGQALAFSVENGQGARLLRVAWTAEAVSGA